MPLRQAPFLRPLIAWIGVFRIAEGAILIINPGHTEQTAAWTLIRQQPLSPAANGAIMVLTAIVIAVTLVLEQTPRALLTLVAALALGTFLQFAMAAGFLAAAIRYGDGGWLGSVLLIFAGGTAAIVTARTYLLVRSLPDR